MCCGGAGEERRAMAAPSMWQQLNPGGRGGLAGGEEWPVRMLPQKGSSFLTCLGK